MSQKDKILPCPESERLPLSALQHLLYCERQCALIHVERLWVENQFTAEGRLLHDRADVPSDRVEFGVRVARALHVWSDSLGLYGVCDVVEWRDGVPIPVEYKRGRPKAHRADEVQVCAQAICLEEMFSVSVDQADIFYGKNRRRMKVSLDEELRLMTKELAAKLHRMAADGVTPPAVYEQRKCSTCSFVELCLPEVRGGEEASRYLREMSQ